MGDVKTPTPPAEVAASSAENAGQTSASPGSAGPVSPKSVESTGLPQEALVADENATVDESFGLDGNASSSASLSSSILKYRHENGRRYHAFKDGAYLLPNDDVEAERMADDNPHVKVIGVDLSPIQPVFIPPNLEFFVDDLESSWTYTNPFDFIYVRNLTGSISDWLKFYRQSFEHLAPGGFIEIADACLPLACDDDTLDQDSALYKWSKLTADAAAQFGRPLRSAGAVVSELSAAGFTDIQQHLFKWPTNTWPKDPKMKEIGALTAEDFGRNIYGISVALFTRALGWTLEEFEIFLVQVRKQMRDPKIHAYLPFYVVYGRKPAEN
ncbi:related to methyltransferase [Cephalotrichum gorgonifer]|uniref:Related to methyltransferase n=1 Tax=Cephalotrichum gorgonifer TaxID=2041049 RepID=A0AAE8MW31_9PEZI|nr:related to methyltransferase [Cephalotrichum gorgonifer]